MKNIIPLLLLGIVLCNLEGVDVSTWDGYIDWGAVKGEVDFAILRAGYGKGSVDDQWENNYNNGHDAGMKLGAYWYSYAYSEDDARNEAYGFMNAFSGKRLEFPVYYDIEEPGIYQAGVANIIARAFCGVLEENRFYCGIYSSASFLEGYFESDVLEKYAIWVAQWEVSWPTYGGQWGIWQYTSEGTVSGIDDPADRDLAVIDYEPSIRENHLNGY